MSSQDSSDSPSGIVRVSVRPGVPDPDSSQSEMNRREAFDVFGDSFKDILKDLIEMGKAYAAGKVEKEQAGARLSVEQAIECAAKTRKIVSEGARDFQEAERVHVSNLIEAEKISDKKLRNRTIRRLEKNAPKVEEHEERIREAVVKLGYQYGFRWEGSRKNSLPFSKNDLSTK